MTIEEKIEELINRQKEINKQEDELFLEAIDYLFGLDPDLNLITFVGITPSFNDGEPCEHSENIYFNTDESEDYDEYKEIDYEKEKKYRSFIDFSYYHERKYQTNYKVTYTKKDGKVVSKYEDYYCGY